jgi:hypothetical protein
MLRPIGRCACKPRSSVYNHNFQQAARKQRSIQLPLALTSSLPPLRAASFPPSVHSIPLGISSQRLYATSTLSQDLKKTPLYDLHVQNGATMVPFGGYHMPVQYKDLSLSNSATWTREKASIFDVSHMYAAFPLACASISLKRLGAHLNFQDSAQICRRGGSSFS